MRVSSQIRSEDCHHYAEYTWTNEKYLMYKSLFDHINRKADIKHLFSVGGGDHVLFALAHLGSIRRLTHVDISSYSLAGALVKYAMILHCDFDEWYAFTHLSVTQSFVQECLAKSGFAPLMQELQVALIEDPKDTNDHDHKADLFHGLRVASHEKVKENRRDFFLLRPYFNLIKRRLKRITRLDMIVHDLWTLTDVSNVDLALLSNAYHYDKQAHPGRDFLIRPGGWAIYTVTDGSWFPPGWKVEHVVSPGDWHGHLYRRMA